MKEGLQSVLVLCCDVLLSEKEKNRSAGFDLSGFELQMQMVFYMHGWKEPLVVPQITICFFLV